MNYELFKEVVAKQILGFMPTEYQNSRVEINSVTKVNQIFDGLNVIPQDGGNTKIFPTIYVNTMYEHYKECGDLEEVLKKAAASIDNAFHKVQNNTSILNFEEAKDNIVMQLVNREQNKELLENLPHRDFQDLSIIYRWLVENDLNGISSAIVNTSLAEKIGMNEEQLFQAAVVNTKTLLPPKSGQ